MLRPVRHLARPLSLCLLLAVGAAQAVGTAQAAAPAGQTATLSVIFGLRDLLVNRDAPNTVRLTTPGDRSAEPSMVRRIPTQSTASITAVCGP